MKIEVYEKLKNKLYKELTRMTNISEIDFQLNNLDKNEVLMDLTKFMVFIEEFEVRQKTDGLKLADYKKQFVLINKYLEGLKKEI